MRKFGLIFLVAALPALAGINEDWSELYGLAQHAASLKDYAAAEATYTRALQKAQLFGPNDARIASTLNARGLVLRSEKKLAEAEQDLQRAVTIYSASPGEGSIEFAQAHLDLAQILLDEGKYQPALQSIKLLLPIFDTNLGPNDDKMAAALCIQGETYRILKLYGSAETSLKRCADIQAENGNVGSPEFGEVANGLALVYQRLGKYSESDRYFTYAEKIREKALGLLSPQLAETLEAHAALLHQLGRDSEAKPKERMAAAIRAHAKRK